MTQPFFEDLKHLVRSDDSSDVPIGSLRRAHAIFSGIEKTKTVFSLRRLVFADKLLRKSGISQKMVFEFDDDSFVQITLRHEEQPDRSSSFRLEGFFSGFQPNSLVLFCGSRSYQVTCEESAFSLTSLQPGNYSLMFEDGGKRFWIKNVEIRET